MWGEEIFQTRMSTMKSNTLEKNAKKLSKVDVACVAGGIFFLCGCEIKVLAAELCSKKKE